MILCFSTLLSACGEGAQADEPADQFQIRAPRATFTPTTVGMASDSAVSSSGGDVTTADLPSEESGSDGSLPGADAGTLVEDNASSASVSGAAERAVDANLEGYLALVNTALVNGRAGPGTDFDVIGIVGRGESYDVLGQNETGDWWRVCCYEDQEFWIIKEYVDVTVGGAAVQPAPSQNDSPEPLDPDPTVAATAEPQSVAESAPEASEFELVIQEQFPETTVVRLFVYVYSEQVQALAGYSAKVTKDGSDLPVDSQSFGPQAGFTWPIANARQRFQNLKVEFPGENPAGEWIVELIDSNGQPVGPPAVFTLSGNDPNQELYVRYQKK